MSCLLPFSLWFWILTLGVKKPQLIALRGLSLRSALESRGPKVPQFQWDILFDWYEEATKRKPESQTGSLRDSQGKKEKMK